MEPFQQIAAGSREGLVSDTFVELADTLAGDYEVGDFVQLLAHRCTEILQADTTGVLLEGSDGRLELAGAVSEEMYAIERAEIDLGEGPCIDAYRNREPVVASDLSKFEDRWPRVVPKLHELGMRAGYGFPIQLRGDCIGALNLYRREPGEFHDHDIRLGQAFAHIAAIGILQERKVASAEQLVGQLQHTLDARVLIEQAKGVLAQRHGMSLRAAFELLRTHARNNQLKVRDLSQRIVLKGLQIPADGYLVSMRAGGGRGLDTDELLWAVEQAPPVMAADVVGRHLGEEFGASAVALLVADYSGRALTRLSFDSPEGAGRTQGRESGERVSLDGTPHGRVLASQQVEVVAREGGVSVYAPVSNRGEAIGILELVLPGVPDDRTVVDVGAAARALAYIVIANRRFTDLYEWGQRSRSLTLAAEVQHRLLPDSLTCAGGQFTLAAWLEPAGEVAGDTFDFTVERDVLHVSMTDAMGHGVEASVLATLLVGALRNARRAGADLAEQARMAAEELGGYVGGEGGFATGLLARIDLREGTASIVNAGHPAPLRLRDGVVEDVILHPDLPFGILADGSYQVQPLSLASGDRLLFLTDGMLERNAAGVDIEGLIADSAGMHPREAVQYLTRAVREAAGGELQDDATILCVDWHGDAGHLYPSATTKPG